MAMWGRRALWWGLQWRRNSEEEGEATQYHGEEGGGMAVARDEDGRCEGK
jgi:hypothetical protein